MVLKKLYQCPVNRIPEVLKLVGLSHTGNKKTSQFSLGMKQRLGIAVALLHEPSLIILDEPTNGLDPNSIIEVRELLKQLNQTGITILISSHLLSEIEKLVTHIGIINKGKMLFQGTLTELKDAQQSTSFISLGTSDDIIAMKILQDHSIPARMENGRLMIPLMSKDEITRINAELVNSGIGVHEITIVKSDLEAIFMDMINN